MGTREQVGALARAADAACWREDEARAQELARAYRSVLLDATPGDLGQAQFLCILAAVLGRFVRDMAGAPGGSARLADAVAGLVRRHAGIAA